MLTIGPRILLFLLMFLILFPCQVTGQNNTASLITILIPGLTLEDLKAPQLHHLPTMAAKGSLGLMNTLSGGNKQLPNAYLTLGSGTRAASPKEGVLGFEQSEEFHGLKAADLYLRYTGNPSGDARIIHPYYYAVYAGNSPELKPGLLGGTLQENAVPVTLLGNHDLPGVLARPGVLFAMDHRGKVPEGAIDQRCNKISIFSPTYYTTNYPYLLTKTKQILQSKKGLIILDLGDLSRLENLSSHIAPNIYQKTRESILAEMDALVGVLIKLSQEHGASLLLVTPYPSKNEILRGNTLAPVIYYPSQNMPGLLTSASTKREGIVTNLDIVPTILNFFHINPPILFTGTPLQVIPREKSLEFLFNLQEKLLANHQQRPQILKPYVFLQIIIILSTIFLLLLHHPWVKYCRYFLLLLTLFPLIVLFLPLFPSLNIFSRTLFILTSLILCTVVLEKKYDPIKRLAFPYLLTAFFIVADLLQGAPLMKSSLLGYDPISGARYYGIGNEYMGVLLGSSLMGLSLFLGTSKSHFSSQFLYLLLPLLAIFLTGLIAAPQWGTNVGGGITFFVSFGIFLLAFFERKINIKTITTLGLCTGLVLFALFYFDFKRPLETQSHIGLTARIIQEQGLSSFFSIAGRKIAMNIKLIRYTIWSRVFMTFLGTFALLFYRPPGLVKGLMERYPELKAGFLAGITGTFTALIVNDSGIVAAATSMIFVAPTLLYLAVESIAKDEG